MGQEQDCAAALEDGMLAIVVVACLITDPNVCKTDAIPMLVDVPPAACVVGAAPFVARWGAEHPGWRVVRWRCRPASEKDASVVMPLPLQGAAT